MDDGQSLLDQCLGLPADGTRLVVAVSGGCDSMALLELLRVAGRWPLVVYHLDHQLRDESFLDAQLVRDYCQQHQINCCGEVIDVAALAAQRGQGIEVCARDYRYQRLQDYAAAQQSAWIVTAHHRDDQAESILLNIFRGAGAHGLAGMRVRRDLGVCHLLRPALALARQDLRAYAEARGVAWCEDLSNNDTQYRRNFIRHQVLPTFEAACPGFTTTVLERAQQQRQRLQASEVIIDQHWTAVLAASCVSCEQLDTWNPEQSALFWRRLLMHLQLPVSRAHVVRCLALRQVPNTQRLVLGSYQFIKNPDSIAWFQPIATTIYTDEQAYILDNRVLIDDVAFTSKQVECIKPQDVPAHQAIINPQALQGTLHVRRLRAGERWQPLGAPGHKNIYQYLSDKKYPQQKRSSIYVVADESGVIWIPGFTIAERVKLSQQDKQILLTRTIKKGPS